MSLPVKRPRGRLWLERSAADELLAYARAGWIDTLHSYGDFSQAVQIGGGFTRDHAQHAIELLNKHNKFELVLNQVRAMRREKAMAQVQVGDKVRLLVDIGSIKKGRVCKVVEVMEPSFYVARGAKEWEDEKYPIKVLPVPMATDPVSLGPKDGLPLMRGEFGPLDEEVGD